MAFIWPRPARMHLSLARRLDYVVLNACYKRVPFILVKGPSANESLVEEIFLISIRHRRCIRFTNKFVVSAGPTAQCSLPSFWNLGQNSDPCARILRSFRVMRRRRVHAIRPILLASSNKLMEVRMIGCRNPRIAPNLVQRCQRKIDVESSVFQTLCHNRPGELLPARDERETGLSLIGTNMFCRC